MRWGHRPGGCTTVTVYVEPGGEDDAELKEQLLPFAKENGEVEIKFDCSVSAYDPGKLSGPPEDCYPPEGGEVEIIEVWVEGKRVDDMLADFLGERFRSEVEEKAPEYVMDAFEAAAEDAAEAKAEMRRE